MTRVACSLHGISFMHLVQEHAYRGCHPHGEPCVMSIEAYVPRRPAVTCTERVA